jgi:hypothetical protein
MSDLTRHLEDILWPDHKAPVTPLRPDTLPDDALAAADGGWVPAPEDLA